MMPSRAVLKAGTFALHWSSTLAGTKLRDRLVGSLGGHTFGRMPQLQGERCRGRTAQADALRAIPQEEGGLGRALPFVVRAPLHETSSATPGAVERGSSCFGDA
mmetsp:Transcript_3544/g.8985  ORF Transcript_3544/g.8985 Transcript_3544/m.8985 type:complete len:104 (+) Transcript_3544:769-1080(+)